MFSNSEIQLAQLALYAYDYSARNHSGIPDEYRLVASASNVNTGFQAHAFESPEGELIVAFTGTRFAPDEGLDVGMGAGRA